MFPGQTILQRKFDTNICRGKNQSPLVGGQSEEGQDSGGGGGGGAERHLSRAS